MGRLLIDPGIQSAPGDTFHQLGRARHHRDRTYLGLARRHSGPRCLPTSQRVSPRHWPGQGASKPAPPQMVSSETRASSSANEVELSRAS